MNAVVAFVLMFAGSMLAASVNRWPVRPAAVEAAGFAGGMVLIFFGTEIALPYTVKAMLLATCVLVSTWTFDRMVQTARAQRDRRLMP
ncbi:MAG: hypothetical protein IT341_05720 [Chloroflexi bacterium]|nr:hypothetical protein [Chloroflexota bacterium]